MLHFNPLLPACLQQKKLDEERNKRDAGEASLKAQVAEELKQTLKEKEKEKEEAMIRDPAVNPSSIGRDVKHIKVGR